MNERNYREGRSEILLRIKAKAVEFRKQDARRLSICHPWQIESLPVYSVVTLLFDGQGASALPPWRAV